MYSEKRSEIHPVKNKVLTVLYAAGHVSHVDRSTLHYLIAPVST